MEKINVPFNFILKKSLITKQFDQLLSCSEVLIWEEILHLIFSVMRCKSKQTNIQNNFLIKFTYRFQKARIPMVFVSI